MTRPERDLIRDYFRDGPEELPERVFVSMRSAIERVPQRGRGPWAGASRRLDDRRLRLALVAAVTAAALFATWRLLPNPTIDGPGTSTSTRPTEPPAPLPSTGRIEPGTYVTNPADPIVPLAITFTLPEGWENGGWALIKNGTNLSFWTVTNTYADPCRWSTTALDPPLGPSVDDLVVALRAQAGRNTTAPTPASVGGYSGQRIELDWPADVVPQRDCDGGEYRLWIFGDNAPRANTMGVHSTIWIVDVDGLRVAIEVDTPPNASADQLVENELIVESISFDLSAPAPTSPSPTPSPSAQTEPSG